MRRHFDKQIQLLNESNSLDAKPDKPLVKVTKKRHRRTKLEMLNSRKMEQEILKSMNKKVENESADILRFVDLNEGAKGQRKKKSMIKPRKAQMANYLEVDKIGHAEHNNENIILVDSLSSYEKQIILNEFCEIYQEPK